MNTTRLLVYTALYFFIGLLFVVKYPVRYGIDPVAASIGYAVFVFGGVTLLVRRPSWYTRWSIRRLYMLVTAIAVLLLIAMLQFDPAVIRNARYGLLKQSVDLLLHGSFPWGEPIFGHHSAFPFWFVLALPFYLLGDIGLLLIASFMIAGFVLIRSDRTTAAAGIVLLVLSPAFLYEIATRSGVTANMVLALAYLILVEHLVAKNKNAPIFFLGLLGGLVLSTRGVVFLIFAVYLGYLLYENRRAAAILLCGWVLSFAATIVPFLLWDAGRFWTYGPFTHQLALTHFNGWFIAGFLAAVFVWGYMLRSWRAVIEACGGLLFLGVAASMGLVVFEHGLNAAIMESRFDISYFCFPLPFLIVGWMRAAHDTRE
jgi:hypothetical protein